MDGSPQLLTDVKFTQLRKGGYDPEEVDNYLERINEAVAKLAEKLRAATEQAESATAEVADAKRAQSAAEAELERVRGDGGAAVPADEELAKVLVLAQRAADQAVEEANATATQTVADARAKSVNLLAEAEQERERLLLKAHKKADAAAEDRARELSEQVEALAAARADLEADVEALRAHLDGERDRLRERVDSVRAAIDDPGGLRMATPPELHDTPIPEVDLPGLHDEAEPEPEPVVAEAAEPAATEAAVVAESGIDEGPSVDAAVDPAESGIDEGSSAPAATLAPPPPPPAPAEPIVTAEDLAPLPNPPAADEPLVSTDTVAMPAVSEPGSPAEPGRPQPELVPLVAPTDEAGDPGSRGTIFLDGPPSDPKRVEAQLFAGDPVAENRSFVESSSSSPGDLFSRDEDALGEPDEQADAAMRAFFERDLDDPTVAGRGRFGRRR